MNIEKLIAAAKKIDLVGKRQDEYFKVCQQFVIDTQTDDLSGAEIAKRKQELARMKNTLSFGAGIAELRAALKAYDDNPIPESTFSFDKNQMKTRFIQ